MFWKMLLFSITAWTHFCESYNILLVFPFPYRSHSKLGEASTKLLLNAGHKVTYITANTLEDTDPKLRQIKINLDHFQGNNVGKSIKTGYVGLRDSAIFGRMLDVSYSTLTDSKVQELMRNANETFDLAIVEWMFNDLYSGFSAVFNCPYIWFFPFQHDYEILRLIHETPNPILISNLMTNNIPPLNFQQRMEEVFHAIFSSAQRSLYYDYFEKKAFKDLFGSAMIKRGKTLPSYDVIRYNASMLFCNSHITTRDIEFMPLSYRAIGGIHISESVEPLNKDISTFIESSKNGVILFSIGSYLRAQDMPTSLKKDLLKMFSELNHTVLWKIDEQFEEIPENVGIFPSIPPQRVLANPKCVLFINHGGMLSLIESVHYGVPVVGIPIYGDQGMNVKVAVKRGIARMVSLSVAMVDDLKDAIEEVIRNPRYKENVMRLSWIYHDRLLSPGSELVHWVEHVVATRGAPHLRSLALDTPWYQKYNVDIALVILAAIVSLNFVVNRIIVFKTYLLFKFNVEKRKKIR